MYQESEYFVWWFPSGSSNNHVRCVYLKIRINIKQKYKCYEREQQPCTIFITNIFCLESA